MNELEQRINEADIIITHGGAGCIADALEKNKQVIVVPRLKKYKEHNNDHQLELASVLEKSGRALVAYDIKDLAQMIERAWDFRPAPAEGESHIISIIRKFLVNNSNKMFWY